MSGQHGYTLVEMLVAMAVTSIVLAGTYAAYGFFARQQQLVLSQTELSRNAMRAVDLMQTDIRMAGFKAYNDPDAMQAAQPIVVVPDDPMNDQDWADPADLRLVYDDYDSGGNLQRVLVRYYTKSYTNPESHAQRDRIMRQVRRCNNPSIICDLSNSTLLSTDPDGEPLLDWVDRFAILGQHPKTSGSFNKQYQTLQIVLTLKSPRKLEGAVKDTTKNYSFVARAKNVSLVP